MKIVVSVTVFDGNIEIAEKLVEEAKKNLSNAEVRLLSAPRGLNYSVESPMVEVRGDSLYRREYGRNGFALLKEVGAPME